MYRMDYVLSILNQVLVTLHVTWPHHWRQSELRLENVSHCWHWPSEGHNKCHIILQDVLLSGHLKKLQNSQNMEFKIRKI
jgi:hypothetical protein